MKVQPLQQTIGIIGGGQLGKMMILEAKKFNLKVIILDPTPDCPAHSIADDHLVAAFDDEIAIRQLAERSDVLTYEFEHIGVETLLILEDEGYTIYPTARSLQIIQNKLTQNEVMYQAGVPLPAFAEVRSPSDIRSCGQEFGYPIIVKSCYGGYDGKGNYVVNDPSEAETAFESLGGEKLMVEEFVEFNCEISVIAARDTHGSMRTFPIAENLHHDNILVKTSVPATISNEQREQAIKVAKEVLEVFEGVGIFCVEMFATKDGILVNEVAPRPHNSGHYTIEACVTSQFEQHIRAITGLPLGSTELLRPVVMRNIIGDRGPQPAFYTGLEEVLNLSGVTPHIYGKSLVKPGRKMGHITAIATGDDDLVATEEKSQKALNLIGFEDE